MDIKKITLLIFVAVQSSIAFGDESPSVDSNTIETYVIGDTKYTTSYVRTIEQFRKTVTVDTVAKVLNYTDGLADDNNKYNFWYAYDAKNCIYRKAGYKKISPDSDSKNTVYDVDVNTRELNLNFFDRNSIQYKSYQLKYPSPPRVTTQVYLYADGREIFNTEGVDPKRVNKGWALIYSKYCSGAKKEF